jgi:hypothetical protein
MACDHISDRIGKRPRHQALRISVIAIACLIGAWLAGSVEAAFSADEVPATERYTLNYPVAKQFCLPVESYADDVQQAIQKVGGRTIRHQLNGGYGLPVIITVGGKNLLHLGADVAWYRVGTPVYAVADGVVRISQGPISIAEIAAQLAKLKNAKSNQPPTSDTKTVEIPNLAAGGDLPLPTEGSATSIASNIGSKNAGTKSAAGLPAALGWGNLIVIEHHLPDGSFATSI